MASTHIALCAPGEPACLSDAEGALLVDPSVDPFDRVLVAHALEADLGVLTRDRAFAAYGVRLAA